jgi:hypothetical protein
MFSMKPIQDGGVRYSEDQLWSLFDKVVPPASIHSWRCGTNDNPVENGTRA